jgi:hypothetical protein
MAPEVADAVITDFLKEIGRLLDEAVSITKALKRAPTPATRNRRSGLQWTSSPWRSTPRRCSTPRRWSYTEAIMTPEIAVAAITDLVKEMREQLEQAARVAKAGHACAAAGSPEKGLEIVDDLRQDLRDARKMLDAMLGVSRCSRS